jgi:hypothetical protein
MLRETAPSGFRTVSLDRSRHRRFENEELLFGDTVERVFRDPEVFREDILGRAREHFA